MNETDESVYVRHMLDAVDRVARRVAGVGRDAFLSDDVLHDAVIRQLEILGEAAGRISRATCARYPDIAWQKITGLRHRLVHDYFGVDLKLVWKVATEEIVSLRPQVEAMLDHLDKR